MSAATIVEPTGVENNIANIIPHPEHITEIHTEQIITPLKFLKIRIADNAGKIINADIKREPTRFIASTIIKAVTIAISRLYAFAFMPVAVMKFSSKVTANILW